MKFPILSALLAFSAYSYCPCVVGNSQPCQPNFQQANGLQCQPNLQQITNPWLQSLSSRIGAFSGWPTGASTFRGINNPLQTVSVGSLGGANANGILGNNNVLTAGSSYNAVVGDASRISGSANGVFGNVNSVTGSGNLVGVGAPDGTVTNQFGTVGTVGTVYNNGQGYQSYGTNQGVVGGQIVNTGGVVQNTGVVSSLGGANANGILGSNNVLTAGSSYNAVVGDASRISGSANGVFGNVNSVTGSGNLVGVGAPDATVANNGLLQNTNTVGTVGNVGTYGTVGTVNGCGVTNTPVFNSVGGANANGIVGNNNALTAGSSYNAVVGDASRISGSANGIFGNLNSVSGNGNMVGV